MDHVEQLASSQLFSGSSPDEIAAMLDCLGARTRAYAAGEHIHRMGDVVKTVGLVLSGEVIVESVDIWGNVSVISKNGPGQSFGEVHAVLHDEPLMVNIVSATPSEVVFLPVSRVITTCSRACPFHARTSSNLTCAIARSNLELSRRLLHMTPKSIREKVLSYLSFQAERAGSNEFDIPFNRQQLANYLGVDRSALSSELSHMQKEGVLETNRSHFKLKR